MEPEIFLWEPTSIRPSIKNLSFIHLNRISETICMEYSDLKLLSNVCYVVGILSILFGIIAYLYERQYFGLWVVYPYRDYAFPLVFLGFVFVAIGYVVMERAKEENRKVEKVSPEYPVF